MEQTPPESEESDMLNVENDNDIIEINILNPTGAVKGCSRINYSTLQQDIQLAKIVQQYPCLYDKKNKAYKRNNDPTNEAWQVVSKELDWITSSMEACRLFEVLKKRYSKKKMNFKRAKYYSNSLEYIRRQQEELEKYNFMHWLEPYIRFRTVKLADDITETDDIEECGDEQGFDIRTSYNDAPRQQTYQGNQQNHEEQLQLKHRNMKRKYVDGNIGYSATAQTVGHQTTSKISREDLKAATHRYSLPTQVNLSTVRQPEQIREETHVQVKEIPSSSTAISKQSENSINSPVLKTENSIFYQSKVLEDEDDLFAAMIVTQLKDLNQRGKCLAKHEISNVLFKAQLKQLDEK